MQSIGVRFVCERNQWTHWFIKMCKIIVHQGTPQPEPSLLLCPLAHSLRQLSSISQVQKLTIPRGWRVGVCQISRQFDIQLHSVWLKTHQKPMWDQEVINLVEMQRTFSAILSQSSPSILVSRSMVESDWIVGSLNKWSVSTDDLRD